MKVTQGSAFKGLSRAGIKQALNIQQTQSPWCNFHFKIEGENVRGFWDKCYQAVNHMWELQARVPGICVSCKGLGCSVRSSFSQKPEVLAWRKIPLARRLFSCDISQANLPQAGVGSAWEPPFPGAGRCGNFLLASLGRPWPCLAEPCGFRRGWNCCGKFSLQRTGN